MGALKPWHLIILVLAFIILFGFKRLPDAARSIGRSMRIFKSEVDEMKKESEAAKSDASSTTVKGEPIEPASSVDRAIPTTEGNAVRENAPRTDNQSGPVA
mgnify:CR=1 FL=1